MEGPILSATGLPAKEKRAIERAASHLGVVYEGNLTSDTTHLLATAAFPGSAVLTGLGHSNGL